MSEPRILVVGASASLAAALVAALAGTAQVTVVGPELEREPHFGPTPLQLADDMYLAEIRTPAVSPHGPPTRRGKGKNVRWPRAAASLSPRGTRSRNF